MVVIFEVLKLTPTTPNNDGHETFNIDMSNLSICWTVFENVLVIQKFKYKAGWGS